MLKSTCLIIIVFILSTISGKAQTDRSPQISPKDSTVALYTELSKISWRTNTTFLVEGVPYGNSNTTPDNSRQFSSVSGEVNEIAGRYDYAVTQLGNTFLLSKKYTNPGDLPEISLEEWDVFLQEILEICEEATPSTDKELEAEIKAGVVTDQRTNLVRRLYSSLTPDQKQAAEHPGPDSAGCLMQSLSAEQKNLLLRLLADTDLGDIRRSVTALSNAISIGSDRRVTSSVQENNSRIGVEYFVGDPVNRTIILPFAGTPDKLIEQAAAADKKSPPKLPFLYTLKELSEKLNTMSPKEREYTISPVVANRHIQVIGVENAKPIDIFRSVARLHQLRIVSKGPNAFELVHPRRKPNISVANALQAIIDCLPLSLLRAGHYGALQEFRNRNTTPLIVRGGNAMEREIMARPSRMAEFGAIALLNQLSTEATSLRQTLARGVPVSDLTSPCRNLLPFAFGTEFLTNICNRSTMPSYPIRRADDLYIAVYHVRSKLAIEIGVADPQGKKEVSYLTISIPEQKVMDPRKRQSGNG